MPSTIQRRALALSHKQAPSPDISRLLGCCIHGHPTAILILIHSCNIRNLNHASSSNPPKTNQHQYYLEVGRYPHPDPGSDAYLNAPMPSRRWPCYGSGSFSEYSSLTGGGGWRSLISMRLTSGRVQQGLNPNPQVTSDPCLQTRHGHTYVHA